MRKKPTPKLIRKPSHQSSKVLLKVAALCLEPPWPLTASSLLLRSQRATPIGVVLFSADSPLLSIPACNPNQGSPPQPLTTYVGCLLPVRKEKMKKYTALLRAASSQGLATHLSNAACFTQAGSFCQHLISFLIFDLPRILAKKSQTFCKGLTTPGLFKKLGRKCLTKDA